MNLDLTATPIIVADGGGRLIYKNAAAKKLLPGCRKGTPLIRYLSAVGYDSYLQMRCDTIERYDIIVFDNTYSMCRNSLAGCYNYNGERRTEFIFLNILQRNVSDALLEYARSVSLCAGSRLTEFVVSQGELNDIQAPAAAWNYTRRNTMLYDVSEGFNGKLEKRAVPAAFFIDCMRDILIKRVRILGYRLSVELINTMSGRVAVWELARFIYTFVPAVMLMLKCSDGDCHAEILCEDGEISASLHAEIDRIGRVTKGAVSMTELASALEYDDIPSAVVSDVILESCGMPLQCIPSGRSMKSSGNLELKMHIPVSEIREEALFSPEAERKFAESIMSAFYDFVDISATDVSETESGE